jgi:tRNA G10  N-methylase Trm11
VLNNFKFREYRKLKIGNFNFWCTNKLCNASVIVSNNSDQIVDQSKNSNHNHEVYSDQIISREIVRSSLKRKADNDLHTRSTN